MIPIKKPNSICKNINCGKLFYACAYCTHKIAWRAVACSPECFDAYMNQVAEARANNVKVDTLPKRTDMTAEEVKELVDAPTEEVVEETKKELEGYSQELDSLGLNGTVDLINSEIDSALNESIEQDSGNSAFFGKTNKKKNK